MKRQIKLSAFDCWMKKTKENLTDEQYKELLKEHGIIHTFDRCIDATFPDMPKHEVSESEYETLKREVGELLEGEHPDEIHPRAASWLQERRNWAKQVEVLENQLRVQKAIVARLKEKYNHVGNDLEPPFSLSDTVLSNDR